jgi:hypothetical protein
LATREPAGIFVALSDDRQRQGGQMMEAKRRFVRMLMTVTVVIFAAVPAWAAEETTAKVTIETMSVGAGLGFTWGDGVLDYRGERYPFKVSGFSLGEVGVAKTAARGLVFNLKNAEEFPGLFMAALAGGTLGGGASYGATHNQNDVSMVWTAANQGLNFTLAHAGVKITFTPEAQQQAARIRQQNAAARQAPAATPATSQ